MRALTVRQPYCDAIAYGTKRIENRTKALPPKYAGVPVLLHAAQKPHASRITASNLADITGQPTSHWPGTLKAGLAVVTFRGSHRSSPEGWCCRPWGQVETRVDPVVWHWEITSVVRLAAPVPVSGALGFWKVPDTVLDQIAHGCHDLPYEDAQRILTALDKEPIA